MSFFVEVVKHLLFSYTNLLIKVITEANIMAKVYAINRAIDYQENLNKEKEQVANSNAN